MKRVNTSKELNSKRRQGPNLIEPTPKRNRLTTFGFTRTITKGPSLQGKSNSTANASHSSQKTLKELNDCDLIVKNSVSVQRSSAQKSGQMSSINFFSENEISEHERSSLKEEDISKTLSQLASSQVSAVSTEIPKIISEEDKCLERYRCQADAEFGPFVPQKLPDLPQPRGNTKDSSKMNQKNNDDLLEFETNPTEAAKKNFFTAIQFECDVPGCKFTCPFRGTMRRHTLMHSNPKPHGCPKCPKRYRDRSSLTVHMKSHENTKKPRQKCKFCTKVLSKTGMFNHVLAFHPKERKRRSTGLKDYISTLELVKIDGKDVMQCPICNKTFPSIESMYHHKKRGHVPKPAEVFAISDEVSIRRRVFKPTDYHLTNEWGLFHQVIKPWGPLGGCVTGFSCGYTGYGNVKLAAKENFDQMKKSDNRVKGARKRKCSARRHLAKGWVCRHNDVVIVDIPPFQGQDAACQGKFRIRHALKDLFLDTFKPEECLQFFSAEDDADIVSKVEKIVTRLSSGVKDLIFVDEDNDDDEDIDCINEKANKQNEDQDDKKDLCEQSEVNPNPIEETEALKLRIKELEHENKELRDKLIGISKLAFSTD